MAEELSAGDAASVYFFHKTFKGDEAKTRDIMIRFKGDNDTEEQITEACRLFFADLERHVPRAIEYERQKEETKQLNRDQTAARVERRRKAGEFKWTWPRREVPISDEDFAATENYLQLKLPSDYKEFTRLHGGLLPVLPNAPKFEPLCVNVDTRLGGKGEQILLGRFYDPIRLRLGLFDKRRPGQTLQDDLEGLPVGLVPFADTRGDGYLCFDYRVKAEYPPVVMWDAGISDAEEIYSVARTFTDYISLLHPTRLFQERPD